MTLTYLPAAQANAAIEAMITPSTTYYLGLCDGSPSNTGANEVSGGAGPYARQVIQFGAASSGVMTSTDAQNFTGMPSTTVDHFLVNASVSGAGTYELGGPTGSSLTVPAGATVAFALGAVTLTISG